MQISREVPMKSMSCVINEKFEVFFLLKHKTILIILSQDFKYEIICTGTQKPIWHIKT